MFPSNLPGAIFTLEIRLHIQFVLVYFYPSLSNIVLNLPGKVEVFWGWLVLGIKLDLVQDRQALYHWATPWSAPYTPFFNFWDNLAKLPRLALISASRVAACPLFSLASHAAGWQQIGHHWVLSSSAIQNSEVRVLRPSLKPLNPLGKIPFCSLLSHRASLHAIPVLSGGVLATPWGHLGQGRLYSPVHTQQSACEAGPSFSEPHTSARPESYHISPRVT